MKILVVEDDKIIRESLLEMLGAWGYACDGAENGLIGWEMSQQLAYDLVILDLNLPKLNGLEVCKRMRQQFKTQPLVLMLTARDSNLDKVSGLEQGADEYLIKPFDANVLHAHLKALLRRASRTLQTEWQWGKLKVGADGHSASFYGHGLKLTAKEHLILETLIKAQGQSCSKEKILDSAWAWSDSPGEESIKTHVKNLRAKLSRLRAPVDLIETVYGIGFRLNPLHAN